MSLHSAMNRVRINELEAERDRLRADRDRLRAENARLRDDASEARARMESIANDKLGMVADLRAENARLWEALEPNAETKRAYIGEFHFDIEMPDPDDGDDVVTRVDVPWTTVKEIMAAIRARAALNETAPPRRGTTRGSREELSDVLSAHDA
jgi:cell division protein FtsL